MYRGQICNFVILSRKSNMSPKKIMVGRVLSFWNRGHVSLLVCGCVYLDGSWYWPRSTTLSLKKRNCKHATWTKWPVTSSQRLIREAKPSCFVLPNLQKNIHPHVILDQIEACKVELNRTHKNKKNLPSMSRYSWCWCCRWCFKNVLKRPWGCFFSPKVGLQAPYNCFGEQGRNILQVCLDTSWRKLETMVNKWSLYGLVFWTLGNSIHSGVNLDKINMSSHMKRKEVA